MRIYEESINIIIATNAAVPCTVSEMNR